MLSGQSSLLVLTVMGPRSECFEIIPTFIIFLSIPNPLNIPQLSSYASLLYLCPREYPAPPHVVGPARFIQTGRYISRRCSVGQKGRGPVEEQRLLLRADVRKGGGTSIQKNPSGHFTKVGKQLCHATTTKLPSYKRECIHLYCSTHLYFIDLYILPTELYFTLIHTKHQ